MDNCIRLSGDEALRVSKVMQQAAIKELKGRKGLDMVSGSAICPGDILEWVYTITFTYDHIKGIMDGKPVVVVGR